MASKKKEKEVTEAEPKAEPKLELKEKLHLLAWFKGIDAEGDRVKLKYESDGDNLEEAVNNVEFPKNLNVLVTLEVSRGDNLATATLAPHDARNILEHKQWGLLGKSFREV